MSALNEKERQELSLLLPWYANGTLNSEDTRKIEAALAQDEALAREFDLVLEDQAAVTELVSEEEVPISISERFKAALNAELDAPAKPVAQPVTGDGIMTRLAAMLFPERPRAYAMVAAAVIVLVPAVALFSVVTGNPPTGQYETASGDEDTAATGTRMLVKFAPEVAWTDIDAFLRENRGQIVGGPTSDGLYELEFETTEETEEADAIGARMSAQGDIFEFALPAN